MTVVLSGFLTNCCVESTMRTAYEKGTDAAPETAYRTHCLDAGLVTPALV